MTRSYWVIIALLASTAAQAAGPVAGRAWWDTVTTLADDRFEGRETGSDGERRAQQYLVSKLRALRIPPAGSNGYFQPVRLTTREINEAGSSLALVRDGQVSELTLGVEAFISLRYVLAHYVEAPLVFVGYGLEIPEHDYHDLAGLDLRGKIAVSFAGSPAMVPSALAAHYQSRAERWKVLKAAGAIGLVSIPNPAAMDVPWSRMSLNRTHPSMELAGAEFDETAGSQLAVVFNPEHAERLFEGTGHTFAEIAALGKVRQPLPRFALPWSLRATVQSTTHDVVSANLVARVPGRDPQLRSEHVVLSAHLDHLGIGAPVDGDRIYNGAMDNASGSALLLDLARTLMTAKPLKRSVLLLWVTGEEKGLLGSRYFAAHPTVPARSMVADINTDMFLPIMPLKLVTVYGLAESDLGERVTTVARQLGLEVQADPEPLRNLFIRSDQYSFIQRGIPSLALKIGFNPDTPEATLAKKWLTERYHAPSDDAQQPVDLQAAAGFEELLRALTIEVADDPERPHWKHDSFFRRYATDRELEPGR